MSKKIIAVTGGIGSGKTLALNILRQAGYKADSCDEITAELYGKRKVKEEIGKIFPSAISGNIRLRVNKKEIAKCAFSDKDKRERLNAFLHPLIVDTAIKRAKRGAGDLSFVEVPLLFESETEKLFDGVLIVMRDRKSRIESVKIRSDLSEQEVLERINAQIDYDRKDFSDYSIIYNDGDKEKFRKSVLEAVKTLRK